MDKHAVKAVKGDESVSHYAEQVLPNSVVIICTMSEKSVLKRSIADDV